MCGRYSLTSRLDQLLPKLGGSLPDGLLAHYAPRPLGGIMLDFVRIIHYFLTLVAFCRASKKGNVRSLRPWSFFMHDIHIHTTTTISFFARDYKTSNPCFIFVVDVVF